MNREQFSHHRQKTLFEIMMLVDRYSKYTAPPYKYVIEQLEAKGYKTAWGNDWTMPRLCMFLQRMGFVGLHGVKNRHVNHD